MPKAARISLAVVGAGAALALGLAAAALLSSSGSAAPLAGTTSETETTEQAPTRYRASITAKAEVPKPTGARPNAGGTFNVTLTDKGSSYSLKWTLTFRNLTGRATGAHIHRGKVGKAGPVVLALCGPCTSGRTRTVPASNAVVNAMKAGSTYVNVHTAKNKAGEIRGQIRKAG
jgi:Cu/Zn superoxide dismutase